MLFIGKLINYYLMQQKFVIYVLKIGYSGTSLVLCTILESLSTLCWPCSKPRTISAAADPGYGNGAELQG